MLKYTLTENLLTQNQNDYKAKVVHVNSYNLDDIINQMLKRGSLLTETDIRANFTMFFTVVEDMLSNGDAVTTPLFNAFPSISGVFDSATDTFDESRHKININLNPGVMLSRAQRNVKTEKVLIGELLPAIVEVKDIASGSINSLITAGGIINITGTRMRYLENVDNNGLFFINSENGNETKMELISLNKPSIISGLIPPTLLPGTYWIEVRSSNAKMKNKPGRLKVARFSKLLTL